ncbi:daptide biosynthesis intramembrane metalloprotease [Kitasatospora sp. NPDC101155]|uniref:daptide biosynthesis intramembrane metalloprotease n=1 Tax=Kitasatospora sp. NPDC101155 TaxID=3364097 RepID=UPI00382BB69E
MSVRAPSPRPALASDVSVQPPAAAGGPWVVMVGERPQVRVGGDVARVLGLLDGRRDQQELLAELGDAWTARTVDELLARFASAGLLDTGENRPRGDRRVAFRPPLTVQFTLGNPTGLLTRTRGWYRPLLNPVGRSLALLPTLGGLVALLLLRHEVTGVLAAPVALPTLAALAGAMLVATVLHELGHGAVLTHFGGRPHRLGFMLFYLSPAFFCDVTDGWRLPRRRQRVAVALAGISVHCLIGGAAAVTALAVRGGGLRDGLLMFALSCYVMALTNLVPLVRLDGYLALMAYLDLPHLRTKAVTDARHAVSDRLFGGRHPRELPQYRWAVAFGLGCMAFPVVLVGLALQRWLSGSAGLGAAPAAVYLAVLGLVLALVCRSVWRTLREGWASGSSRLRVVLVTALLASTVAALGAGVRVPYRVTAGYVVDGGQVLLVLPEGADPGPIRPGVPVRLESQGLFLHRPVGQAVVAGGPRSGTAPITAFFPVDAPGITVSATGYPLAPGTGAPTGLPISGRALIEGESLPAAEWVWRSYVTPALCALTG